MTDKETMQIAMAALKELVAQTEGRFFSIKHDHFAMQDARAAISRLREALAVGCMRSHPHEDMGKECELRTEIARLRNKLAQRSWIGLDAEEIRKTDHHMVVGAYHYSFKQGARWAEDKLKEKNHVK
jgi:hypothetical protein